MKKNKPTQLILLCSSTLFIQPLWAEDIDTYNEVLVIDSTSSDNVNDIKINAKVITKQLIQDSRDLVREETGVSVTNAGRYGNSGFNIRGVDENRVAILIDGVPQAEVFDNEIYKGYGYFNGSINDVELDSVKRVTIAKGSDALFTGSGSLGGSVSYETKEAKDLLKYNNNLGFYNKSSYSSKNDGFKNTLGFATIIDNVDFMTQYTYRDEHETETRDKGIDIYGHSRSMADPVDKKNHYLLSKIGYQLTDKQRLQFSYENFNSNIFTDEKSWALFSEYRQVIDISKRQKYLLSYDYNLENNYLNQVNLDVAYQHIVQQADSYTYDLESNKIGQNYNREIVQKYKSIKLDLKSNPNDIFSFTTNQRLVLSLVEKDFVNNNIDRNYIGGKEYITENSIIEPVTTQNINFSLSNDIALSGTQNLFMGLRFDSYHHNVSLDGKSISSHLYGKSLDAPKDSKFNALSWALLYENQLSNDYLLQYKVSTGFRAPSAQELYFSFGDIYAANRVEPNKDLKGEHGLTNELALTYQSDNYYLKSNIYYTAYNDFIDLKTTDIMVKNFWFDPNRPKSKWNSKTLPQRYLQYQNIDSAAIYGIDIKSRLRLSSMLTNLDGELYFDSGLSYAKGRGSDGDSLMSIQPIKIVNSLKFNSADETLDIGLYTTYLGKKAISDTIRNGQPWKYRNDSAFLVDLVTNIELYQDVNLNLGLFNILNKKYKTWDAVRSIPTFGTTNQIDSEGKGLNRFTAPGINWAVSIDAKF